MKKNSSSESAKKNVLIVQGTVRNHDNKPVPKLTVQAYSKSIRGKKLLGEAVTDASGFYAIRSTPQKTVPTLIVISVLNGGKTALSESEYDNHAAELLNADIHLNETLIRDCEYEQLVNVVTPFTEQLSLSALTETDEHHDISFIAKTTGRSIQQVENLAMAARFEQFSSITADIWYAILHQNLPRIPKTVNEASFADFETRLKRNFDGLMHTSTETLIKAVKHAVRENVIAGRSEKDIDALRTQITGQLIAYAKKHPVSGDPTRLHRKLEIAGLKGKALDSFIELRINHTGSEEEFWNEVAQGEVVKDTKTAQQVHAVFHLSGLTGHHLELVEKLIESHKIKSPADLKRLAGLDKYEWEVLLDELKLEPHAAITGSSKKEKKQSFAAQLEAAFTSKFPTAAFASRLEKDIKSKLPHKKIISKLLTDHGEFDLLHDRVGAFVSKKDKELPKDEAPEIAAHLRKVQRVFKLSPKYETVSALLNDNIHSAHQVFNIGKDNFIRIYADKIGESEATQVFERAANVHAQAVALVGNLKSLSDASTMKTFSSLTTSLATTLAAEIPNVDTLFGHSSACDCSECRSVYGAPAYLTDIVHFLDKRLSTLDVSGVRAPVKDILLRRRPDIAEMDLECNNANTEVPYIDIACELMEDFIAPPVSAIFANSTFLPKLIKGPINAALLSTIKSAFSSSGFSNYGNLLTSAATVSDKYTDTRLKPDNTYSTQDNWIVRDSQLVIKITNLGTNLQCRVLHQTLLSADAISAGPEYVNVKAYDSIKTAKRPFTLPFDLFNTEAELYLEKLGTKKADLIDTFSRTGPVTLNSTVDINLAYASLGINQAEQTLIFTPDTANQALYWGTDSASSAITVSVFEKLTGLNYQQITNLLKLQFINPAKDSVIEHDDLGSDTTTQRITNITATKLDAIHRFLRFWRKTTLTMDELDSFIVNLSIQNGFSAPMLNSILADEIRQFMLLQQSLQLTAFELLGFYGNLDISHNLPGCQFNLVYQNSAITTPVNPHFSIAAIQASTIVLGDPDKLVICSILQISLGELNAMLTQTNTAAIVSFGTLSAIYRHAKLAHALGISLTDLLTLLRLTGPNPFVNPAATAQFIQRYKLILSAGFNIDDLNYILRHQDNATRTLVPTTDQRTAALNQLQGDLLVIKTTTTPAVDTNGALLTKWLSDPVLKWDPSLVNKLMDILSTVDDDVFRQKITDNTNFLLNLRQGYNDAVLTVDLAALPVVAGVPISIPASVAAQLSFDADKKQLILKGVISTADRDALLALSTDTAYQAAINSLYSKILTASDAGNTFFTSASDVGTRLNNLLFGNIADRFAFFINKLPAVYRKRLQSDALVKNISTWFSIDKTLVNVLLANVAEVFNDFTADNFVNKIIDTTVAGNPYPVQANRYQSVAKIFFVFRKLSLPVLAQEQALRFFLTNGPVTMGCLDFRSLPLASVAGSVSTFPGFEAILNLLRFERLYPTRVIPFSTGGAGTYNIFGVLTQTTSLPNDIPSAITAMKNNLAFAYGWSATDLQTLLTANFTTISSFTAASTIMLRIAQSFALLQQLGVALADAQAWCGASLTATDSAKIKGVLKGKCSTSDWVEISKPLQDQLREKKRDALVAYLLTNPGTQTWKDANDLYSYFLLDVEMCSCQPTSRIVEATNAVQLFVQRCFLKLEDFVVVKTKADSDITVAPDSNWLQWKWMKNFRVWQANVKVFLYPENWIEPELLPDDIKSPFLSELENDLLQNEVTDVNAEDAFRSYLQKLEQVARLEVKGMWYDQPSRTLHVFARTFGGNPRIYYHREFIADKRWTPWKKIDLDIAGDHIIPAMYNNRLYLFWAVFTEKADKPSGGFPNFAIPPAGTGGSYSIPITETPKKWQIQIAFSEYKKGKWTPKTISEDSPLGKIEVAQASFPDKTSFVFTALDVPNYDYSKIFDSNNNHIDTLDVFNQKAAGAVSQNGKLVISCYYYSFVANNSFDNNRYVGSFRLDPVKGYPTQLAVNYKIQLIQASSHIERSTRKSVMTNMIDAESFTLAGAPTPPTTGIPGAGPGGKVLVAEQAGGPFGNLIPMQLDLNDRYNYMLNIYNSALSTSFQIQCQIGSHLPYFYQDQRRSYYIVDEYTDNGSYEFLYSDNYDLTMTYLTQGATAYLNALNQVDQNLGLPAGTIPVFTSRYFNFHHPLVDYFIQCLFAQGVDGLMDRTTQLKGDFGFDPSPDKFNFQTYFQPVIAGFNSIYSGAKLPPVVHNGVTDSTPGYPKDDVDFNLQSGYGLYNWELFFHAPLMIAERLSQNQQFEEAERWYRYIFNPMDTSSYSTPNKFWNTKPFFLTTSTDYAKENIEGILKDVNSNLLDVVKNVADWRNNPFQPHFIAQYRTVAYQKAVVMKYVGHLVRHGDYLFRQHTTESVNEATQLYILAQEILGPKPEVIPSPVTTGVDNYYQLSPKLDSFSDALVDVENLMPFQTIKGYNGVVPTGTLPNLKTMYFCIPINENLTGPTGYWDLVADRLFKIRHCLDIDGTFAPLSIFAPAVDPGLLVRASAAGLDIGNILSDTNAALPVYRFSAMVQKAQELCNDVKILGAGLLSALEKKDAEEMALLRSGHEIKLLGSVLALKQKQVDDALSVIDNLNKQKELITIRQKYFSGLLSNGLSFGEKGALGLNSLSLAAEATVAISYIAAGGLSLIPQFVVGASGLGSPVATASEGGQQGAAAADHAAKTLSSIATAADKAASLLSTNAAYTRRKEEWQYQLDLANKELEQVDKQLLGAQIRLDITRQDALNQQLQIDQATEADDLMHNKFTNQELFSWMVTQISATYFKSYQLAYDVARQTERCFRHELGLGDSSYINFGYWDNLKKGLMAGEQLFYDIRKMEMAYMDQNKRELELTKPVSLSQLDPVALLKLKTTGNCWINLPEELFDMDYPGHYMRRIKSVSVTIPCISGPYTTVSTKLTLTKSSIRVSGTAGGDATQYPRKLSSGVPTDDLRFRDGSGPLQSIATSSAQNDSGLFELNFRDERYLPFEGAGAISQWHLELPAAVRQFDYETISDVIIHLRYTARDGGETLRAQAAASLDTKINQMLVSLKDTGLMRGFSARNDLPTEWYRFLHPVNATDEQTLTLNLDSSRFPLFTQGRTIQIVSVELIADSTDVINNLQVIPPSSAATSVNLVSAGYGSWKSGKADYSSNKKGMGTWIIKNPATNKQLTDGTADINLIKVDNMAIIVHYELS